jgi:hypothetical protein
LASPRIGGGNPAPDRLLDIPGAPAVAFLGKEAESDFKRSREKTVRAWRARKFLLAGKRVATNAWSCGFCEIPARV